MKRNLASSQVDRYSLVHCLAGALLLAACGGQSGPVDTPVAIEQQAIEVRPAVHHDASPPLTLMPVAPRRAAHNELEVKPIPKPLQPRSGGPSADSVLQPRRASPLLFAPTLGLNFDGVGVGLGSFTDSVAPPDTNGDVGPNHFVEIVNLSLAVFNKSGALLFGPVTNNTIWSGFGGSCETNNDGDPVVLYDTLANRWVISQFAVRSLPYTQCVAVSQTPDPTGAYFRYAFTYGNTDFVDYPKMGIWPDAYYETYNVFANGQTFSGAKVCAFDRNKMLIGAAATQQCFQLSPTWGGLLPSHLTGSTAPPAGSPNYVVALDAAFTSNLLQYWKFHVDWANPANTSFIGPTAIGVASYTDSCHTVFRGACIPQGGTTQLLESLADRAMFRLNYRNFGNYDAMVFNHTIEVGSGSTLQSGVRWYELRPSGGNLNLFQQGTYAPDSSWRWMGSAALDSAGNIGLGYSVSSTSISPQIHFTGHLATDPPGVMSQGENIVINGGGSQTGNLARWGDYSAMGIDPADGCTFWYVDEYLKSFGSFNWSTRVTSFKLPGCGVPPDFTIGVSPASVTVTAGNSASYTTTVTASGGFSGAVTFSASGLPAGASASFNPSSVAGSGSSTLAIATSTSTPAGSSTITVTGTSGALSHSASTTLVVRDLPPVASFTYSCVGRLCTFDGSGSSDVEGIISYSWSFGDGGTATGATPPDHRFAADGTYQVTLTVTDTVGQTGTQTRAVTVQDLPPHAAFSTVCIDLTCYPNAEASSDDIGIVNYRWDWGDGSAPLSCGSPCQDPAAGHRYAAYGAYTISLTVSDVANQTSTISHQVFLSQGPTPAFSFSCVGRICDFDASATTGPVAIASYHWDWGDESPTGETGPTIRHIYAADGTYQVHMVATDVAGKSNGITHFVTVQDLPPHAGFDAVCINLTCHISSETSSDDIGIVRWDWDWGDGTTLSGPNIPNPPPHTYAAFGTYNITLVVTDQANQTDRTTRTVVLTQGPSANFTFACNNLSCNFDASTSSGSIINYHWDWDDETALDTSATTAHHDYTFAATFRVHLRVTDNQGRVADVTKPVVVP